VIFVFPFQQKSRASCPLCFLLLFKCLLGLRADILHYVLWLNTIRALTYIGIHSLLFISYFFFFNEAKKIDFKDSYNDRWENRIENRICLLPTSSTHAPQRLHPSYHITKLVSDRTSKKETIKTVFSDRDFLTKDPVGAT
jgi:hypothetical protein